MNAIGPTREAGGAKDYRVGATGFEPVTSSVSGKRSPAELSARGGGGNRTRVQGFAGPCLCHSATPPDQERVPGTAGRPKASPSGRRDSNPRPSPWQGDALPTEPRPQRVQDCIRSWNTASNRYRGAPAAGQDDRHEAVAVRLRRPVRARDRRVPGAAGQPAG